MDIEQLIKECQQKKAKAQAILYKQFAGVLFGVSYKYSNNKQEAEDTLHDGFLTILKKIDQYQNKGSFEGWMKRIIINTALEKYRNNKIYPLNDANIPNQEEELTTQTSTHTIDTKVLLDHIQSLPSQYRMVFNLYVLDNYSHKEIANLLQISVGTSKSNLSRAKKILQTKLAGLELSTSNSIEL